MSFENKFLQIKKCDLNDSALDCVDNKTLRVERKLLPIHLKLHQGAVLSIMAFTGRGVGYARGGGGPFACFRLQVL